MARPRQLKGTLQDLHATQLLHLINLAKKTGTLHIYKGVPTGREITLGDGETKRPELQPGEELARAAFREGKLIYARLTSQSDHLATVLHRAGKLNDEQHRIILSKAAHASDKALALLLINANYVSKADIVQSIQRYTLEVIYDLANWTQEPFIFEEGEQPPPDKIVVPIPLENVIIEMSRRYNRDKMLIEALPNLDFALRLPEGAAEKFSKVKLQLSVEEWRVITFINGRNTIRQIARACNMTEMGIRQIVYGLLSAGLVELVKPAAPELSKAGWRPGQINSTMPQRPVINKLIERIRSL
ncbi:MAG: DUF4388 domain-containing protein [Chloroflexi bacterium]|jgi:hypothetical protein|nr:DUF4388 domain-containing protein [Chloroflexota bacterium]